MPGYRDAPKISLDDKASATDTYAFVHNNRFGSQDASSGLGFGIGDANVDAGTPEANALSDSYAVVVIVADRPGVQASPNALGNDGYPRIASSETLSIVDPDHEADTDVWNDDILL